MAQLRTLKQRGQSEGQQIVERQSGRHILSKWHSEGHWKNKGQYEGHKFDEGQSGRHKFSK